MADLRISELVALAGANLAAGDLLPIVDISASETKKITVTDLVGNATTLIADATIPGAKILFSAGQIAGTAVADGGIDTDQLADGAVTAAKLANESTVDLVTTLPASGAFTGQLALDTDDLKVYCWDGSTWQSIKAAGSINTVIGDTAGIVNLTVTTSGDQVTITTSLDDTDAAAKFLAGPAANGGAVSYRTITGADLPTATTSAKGGVIVNGEGLRLDGDTLEIDNDLTASVTHHVVTYDAKGLVTAGRGIQGSDLPAATSSVKGAIIPGTGLAVDGLGNLNHSNVATAGTFTKVTIDAEGHVTLGDTLSDTDIPNHSAAKLTSGTLPAARIGAASIEGTQLANYSTAKIANAAPVAEYIGQLFFNPLDRTLFMWDGNVFQPIGVSYGQVIFAGTYDANTNLVASVTVEGQAIGLAVGASLPAAVAANKAHYVVTSEAGTGTAPAPAIALAPPDILLSTGTEWVQLDVSDTVVAQLASNVQVTPAGDISSTNVQAALQEIDTEKLAKTGGTISGELLIGAAGSLVFEGATDDSFETTLAVSDATADRTITLPNVSGTVVTTGDTGTVTSTMIADGTIVNGDISAIAAIADTKLATISTSGKVANSATTAVSTNTASAIVSRDASGNFSAGTITASLTGAASLNLLKAGDLMTGTLGVIGGNATTPGLYFTGDPNTGLYSPGADQVAISSNAVQRVNFGTSEVVFNDGGENYDFRIEGDTEANLVFVDASTNRVGLGTTSPGASLHVGGTGAMIRVGNAEMIDLIPGASANDPSLIVSSSGSALTFASNGASEMARLDTSGRLLIGTSAGRQVGFAQVLAQIESATNTAGLSILRNTPNSNAGRLTLAKTRGSAVGDSTIVVSGDDLGIIDFAGGDGTDANSIAASILAQVDGTPGANDMPGRLVFSTTADGEANPTQRMRLDSSGRLGLGTIPSERLDIGGGVIRVANTTVPSSETDGAAYFGRITGGAEISNNVFVAFRTVAQERVRIDNAGRLLLGSSSSVSTTSYNGPNLSPFTQLHGTTQAANVSVFNWGTGNNNPPGITLNRSFSGTVGTRTALTTASTDLGAITFSGDDGTNFIPAALILAETDGTPGTNDMPGRIVLSTTADGAFLPTEALRITNDRVIAYNQPDVTSKSAAAILTIAELKTGIIQYTGSTATLTLPTGTLTEGGFSGIYTNMTFEWSVINTGSGTCSIGATAGHTIVGSISVAAGTSGRFASRRTAANTFVTYRLS